ncbi:cyclic diguanylate phosphodiesterase [Aeromonas caviae]
MRLSIENRKIILLITLLLMLIMYVYPSDKPHSTTVLTESYDKAMLSEQMLLMTEIFNTFSSKVNGHCDPLVKSELLSTVMEHPLLYSLTFLKLNQPYCSSYHHDDSHFLNSSVRMSDNNVDMVRNYINIDEEFTIQVEMKSLAHQALMHQYLLAFMVMKNDGNENLHYHINVNQRNGHTDLVSPYISIQLGEDSSHKTLSVGSRIGFLIFAVMVSICFFMRDGQHRITDVFKKHLLKKAIVNHELKPYMQPVVSSTDGRVIGGEILLRWLHPKKGIVYPADFIGIAERSDLIVTITRQLFVRVKEELLEIASHLPAGFKIGFNISPRHLGDPRLVQDCADFIGSFNPGSIVMVLEITERELVVYTDIVYSNISALHQAGIKLAIDDYGTGNSTLRNIQRIPFDYIKIDKSFVDLAATDKISMSILKNIISLAVSVNAQTVAEGVETAEQASLLTFHGVHFQQGWLWSKAIPISDMTSFLGLES